MLIPSSKPVVFPSENGLEKHLGGRHDQSSHAGGAKGYPKVGDQPATAEQNPKAIALAIGIHKTAHGLDQQLTDGMSNIAKVTGGELVGLKFRTKTTQSLTRKIEDDAAEQGISLEKAASKISDSSRYTLQFDDNNYTDGVLKTVDALKEQGYDVSVKNFWEKGDDYQGVNIKLTEPKTGHLVELQIHTPKSFELKDEKGPLHPLYEKYRAKTTSVNDKYTLWNQMVDLSNALPVPKNYDKLLSIPNLVQHEFNPN